MAYILTITSKTGQPVNQITGAPSDSIAVYSTADLNKRKQEAAKNPDLTVHVRKERS